MQVHRINYSVLQINVILLYAPWVIYNLLFVAFVEDERCPQELQAELIFALVRSVFAGFQPMDAREQLCE